MLLQPGAQFRGIGPVAAAPMGKIPLCIVRIALVIHIVKHAAPQDKIGGEVIDIQPGRLQKAAQRPHLLFGLRRQRARLQLFQHRWAGDVLLHQPFLRFVHRQQARHRDAQG